MKLLKKITPYFFWCKKEEDSSVKSHGVFWNRKNLLGSLSLSDLSDPWTSIANPTCCRRMGCSFSWQHAWQLLGVWGAKFACRKHLVEGGEPTLILRLNRSSLQINSCGLLTCQGTPSFFLCFFLFGNGDLEW